MDLDIVQWIIKLGGNFIEYPYRVKISRNLEFSRKLQMYLSGVDQIQGSLQLVPLDKISPRRRNAQRHLFPFKRSSASCNVY